MGSRSSPIIVGRDRELARLDRALEAAASGRPVLAIVRGEAGIGKSRLVREAIQRATAAGSPVLHGACLDLGGDGVPYLPIVEALRGLARETPPDRLRDLLGVAGPDLATLLPALAEAEPHGEAEPGARSLVDRARLFERFLGFLGRLTSSAPVLAVVEDVQWVDPATRDLVTFLIRNITTEPIVAILTCRTDDLAPGHPVLAWLAELGRAPGAIRLDLDRLGSGDIRRQLEAIGDAPVPEDTFESIWRRSEGHPLFAEELFEALIGEGDDHPPSLVDVLLGRVAGLDPDTLGIVQALAVAGRPVDERLVGAVVERTGSEVAAALRAATTRGVLVARADGRHAFRHELLREVVERGLTAGERRELHGRLARQLEAHPELADDNPVGAAGELARHWAAADEPAKAHSSALAAAEAAEAVNAFDEAWRLLERAIALEGELPSAAAPSRSEQVSVRRRAAQAADLSGRLDRASALIRETLTLVDADSDPTVAGVLHARLGYLTWAQGDGEVALAEHREAVRLVPDAPPSTERAHVLGALGGALMGLGRWAESEPICRSAIDCAIQAGAVAEESRARNMLGSDLVALGKIETGLGELRESHRLAGPMPSELFVVTAYNLGLNLLATDRLDEALEVTASGRAAAPVAGLERRYGMELAALAGDVLLRLGRWDEADAAVVAGLALDQRGQGTPYLAAVRSLLLARRGEADDARRRLAAVDRAGQDPDMAAFLGRVDAEALLLEDRPREALEAVGAGLSDLDAIDGTVWAAPLVALGLRAVAELVDGARARRDETALARALADAGRLRDRLATIAERAATPSVVAWVATSRAEAGRADGLVDPETWTAAIGAWDAVPDPAEAAYARYRRAEAALRRSGIKADVTTDVSDAWSTAARLGAAPLRSDIEVLATRARIKLGGSVAPAADTVAAEAGHGAVSDGHGAALPHGLSAREIEVLRLVADGRSNGQIADRLFITRKTAGVHVTHILNKLGVSNRVEAAMAAARLGLVDPTDGDVDQAGWTA